MLKTRRIPATTMKALIQLAQHPQARLLIVDESCFMLDGSSKTHQHTYIPSLALTILREKEWISAPQLCGEKLVECRINEQGRAAARSILELQNEYQQLPLDLEMIDNRIKVTQLAFNNLQEPEPEAVATPVMTPEPEPAVVATPVVVVEPAVVATPVVVVEPEAVATPVVAPEPEPEAVATPVMTPEPEPAVVAIPVVTPAPEPAVVATPVVAPEPEPVVVAIPVVTLAPEPETTAPMQKKRKTKEEAKKERAEKRATMQQNMHQAVSNLLASIKAGKSDHLLQYLAFSAKFHHYSPLNQLMIAFQAPNATRVAGYTTWKNNGYHIRKGEKGIAILAPRPFGKVTTVDEETGKEETVGYQGVTFRIAYVFDVSQLEENPDKPIPTFFTPLVGDHEALYTCLAQAVRADGIVLEIGDTGTAQGYSAGGRIRLKSGLDSTNRVLTLIHEYAHEKLHHTATGRLLSTEKKECHAEAISFIVAHHFQIANPYSSDYLQNWGTTEKELLNELETIKTTGSAIIEAIEEQQQTIATQTPDAMMEPRCFYCQQPATTNAQIFNEKTICTACITQEIEALHPDEIDPPTEPEPAVTATAVVTPEPEPVVTAMAVVTPEPEPKLQEKKKLGSEKISLRYASDSITVSKEGYQKIKEIIKMYAVCERCQQYYTGENPNVDKDRCLSCFLGFHHSLRYVGSREQERDLIYREEQEKELIYLYMDTQNAIYTSKPSSSRSAVEPNYTETLRYWSFPIPTHVEKNGKSVEMRNPSWSIYGDQLQNVCIARAWEPYLDHIDTYFLVSNTGKVTQINKRKASHRLLISEAKKRIEATKENGRYHVGKYHTSDITETEIYTMIAQMVNEDVSLWPC